MGMPSTHRTPKQQYLADFQASFGGKWQLMSYLEKHDAWLRAMGLRRTIGRRVWVSPWLKQVHKFKEDRFK